ncbi:inorganic polyphosphate/ATP-NAD kinase [marine actinobacterium PHSC20C1]|nr:inorganic polyphosphate/ATP-NAD kinase [marine actinobacterium PHSC20C1]
MPATLAVAPNQFAHSILYTSGGIVAFTARPEREEPNLMMWGYGNMGWAWGYGLLALVGIALLVYVVVRLASKTSSRNESAPDLRHADSSGAKRILEERFARGELTAEQYREQLRVLDESR